MEAEQRSPEDWPLSFAQERLWFLNQLVPDCPAYHIPVAWRLRGPLDLAALKRSLAALMQRQQMLATAIAVVGGQPVQRRVPHAMPPLTIEDMRALPAVQRATVLEERLRAEIKRTFDLTQGPLWRALLLRVDDEEYVLLVIFHEIIADDGSVKVFERDLVLLYTAFTQGDTPARALADLPLQYPDYALRQRQKLQGSARATLLSYWNRQLKDVPHVLELPFARQRPAAQTFWSASYAFSLPASLWQEIQLLSRQEQATAFTTLLAAFQALLFRYTEQADVLVGIPISGRQAEIEDIIGPFANTLVLRAALSENPSFRELLARVRHTYRDALAHQDLPFAQLVEALQPERDLSRSPLVQMMFAFQATSPSISSALKMGALELAAMRLERGTTTADLSLELWEEADECVGIIEYNRALFSEEAIARLADHYRTLLTGITANPDQRIANLPILTGAERQELLVEWNAMQAAYPVFPLHRLFETQVEKTPDAVALVCKGEQLTYDALNRSANQLARALQALGVGPEIPVGVLLERSPDMVAGLLGILKAGGAYVPLDPAYPQERLAFTLQNARARVLLTQHHLLSCLPEQSQQACTVVCLDTERASIARQPSENVQSAVSPSNLAYIIYTSGSTGQPKGVAITHQSACIFLHWAREVFHPADLAGTLASTSICFDLSVFELFAPLVWGGKALLVENALHLPELAHTEPVALVNTVPSAMAELVRAGKLPSNVQTVSLAGEALSRELVEQLYACPTVQRVFNLYGPTEDTTYSTWALLARDERGPVPIGRPLPGTVAYLLDQRMQPVPLGVPGELYLGGGGLARGYLNRPDLTAERFVPDPFSGQPGARLYRTGDQVRYRADGLLEYLGRLDGQVKLRGYRIELGEIEACLKRLPLVQEAVVILRRDHDDNAQLAAYVVPTGEGVITVDELQRMLAQHVPAYMIPAAFVLLPALPLSPNGKIDRRALPAPEEMAMRREQPYVAPRNPTEELVAQMWMETLGVSRIGVHENFFKLGGHSLLVMRVLSRLRETFQVEVPLQRFFERPTVASLCEAIEEIIFAEVAALPDEEVRAELKKLAWRE